MSNNEKLRCDIDLARRELKNIRQESMKQKASLRSEIAKIKEFLSESSRGNKGSSYVAKESHDEGYLMSPIGFISSCFNCKNGIPRQPSLCPTAKGSLKIEKSVFTNPEHSLMGLNEFSHIWILFVFHENGDHKSVKSKVHPPRLNGTSVGVFSTRSPHRPCAIGLSLTKLDRIEGSTLFLSGIDLLDGTPVLDIKPYIPLYDVPCISKENTLLKHESNACEIEDHTQNVSKDFSSEDLKFENVFASDSLVDITSTFSTRGESEDALNCNVASYLESPPDYLNVIFSSRAMNDLESFHTRTQHGGYCKNCLDHEYNHLEAKRAIIEILRNDPRSVYRRQKCCDRLYYFYFNNFHVTSWFDDNVAEVLRVKFRNKDNFMK